MFLPVSRWSTLPIALAIPVCVSLLLVPRWLGLRALIQFFDEE